MDFCKEKIKFLSTFLVILFSLVSFLLFVTSQSQNSGTVLWITPSNNSWVKGTIILNVSVDNNTISGNANVTFYFRNDTAWYLIGINNSNLPLTQEGTIFTYSWNTTTTPDGGYWLNASAFNGTNYDENATWYVKIDNTPPWWSNNSTLIVSTYSPTTLSYFNISWTDGGINLSTVLIEGNWSGVSKNYTMISLGGNIYGFNITLPAGNFYWKSYANDSLGNWNYSDTWYFIVNKATPSLSLTISPSNSTTYPTTIKAIGNLTLGDVGANISLYRNNTLVNSSTTLTEITETILLGAGTYNYTFTYSGTQNYTFASLTNITSIAKGILTLSLGITPAATVTYPTETTTTPSETNIGDADVNYTLYRNDTGLVNYSTTLGEAPSAETILLGAGAYLYVLNTTSGPFANWTANTTGITEVLTVNKGILLMSITPDQTVTYPTTTTVTGTQTSTGDKDVVYELWRNDTKVAYGTNADLTETIELGAGVYVYRFNATGGANYTANSTGVIQITTVNKGNNLNISLTCSPAAIVTYPTTTTCTGDEFNIHGGSDITYYLYRNDTLINSAIDSDISETIELGAGSYIYKFNSSEGANWTTNSTGVILTLTVQQNPTNPVNLYFNGTLNNNRTYTYPEGINVTGVAVYSNSGTLHLYRDGVEVASGTGFVTEEILLGNGTYAYKINITGNQNYTSNATGLTFYVFVNKGIPSLSLSASPSWTVTYPTTTTVTGSENNIGDEDVNYSLYRNGVLVANPETITLPIGTYTYEFKASGGQNWTPLVISKDLIVLSPPVAPKPTEEIKVNVTRGQANITIPRIAAGKMANVSIERVEDIAFREIKIFVVNSVNNVKIEIKKLPKLPAEVKVEVRGKVYHYISLDKKNIRDEDIANVTINFEVKKSWIRENNINETTISLYRWDNEWIKLPTKKIKEDEEFIYFKSITKKLSTFAISGEVILPPPKLECPPCPKPSEWGACVEGKQTRTNYRCGPETNYTCELYEESQPCIVPVKPWYQNVWEAIVGFFKRIVDFILGLFK